MHNELLKTYKARLETANKYHTAGWHELAKITYESLINDLIERENDVYSHLENVIERMGSK